MASTIEPIIAGVTITHAERVVSAEPRLTKLDVVRYCEPSLSHGATSARSALTLVQWPDMEHRRYLRHTGTARPPPMSVS